MRLEEGSRVTILGGSIYTGSTGKVISHADGLVAVEIETGIQRGWQVLVMDLLVGPIVKADGKTLEILSIMAPEGV